MFQECPRLKSVQMTGFDDPAPVALPPTVTDLRVCHPDVSHDWDDDEDGAVRLYTAAHILWWICTRDVNTNLTVLRVDLMRSNRPNTQVNLPRLEELHITSRYQVNFARFLQHITAANLDELRLTAYFTARPSADLVDNRVIPAITQLLRRSPLCALSRLSLDEVEEKWCGEEWADLADVVYKSLTSLDYTN